MARRSAMSFEPSMTKAAMPMSQELKRVSPGVYRNSQGNLVGNRGQRLPGQRQPQGPAQDVINGAVQGIGANFGDAMGPDNLERFPRLTPGQKPGNLEQFPRLTPGPKPGAGQGPLQDALNGATRQIGGGFGRGLGGFDRQDVMQPMPPPNYSDIAAGAGAGFGKGGFAGIGNPRPMPRPVTNPADMGQTLGGMVNDVSQYGNYQPMPRPMIGNMQNAYNQMGSAPQFGAQFGQNLNNMAGQMQLQGIQNGQAPAVSPEQAMSKLQAGMQPFRRF